MIFFKHDVFTFRHPLIKIIIHDRDPLHETFSRDSFMAKSLR